MGVLTDIAANVAFTEIDFTVTNTDVNVLAMPDPLRYSIMFVMRVPSATTVSLSTKQGGSINGGIFQTGPGIKEYTLADWGALVQSGWYLFSGTSGWVTTVIAVRIPRDR